MPSSPLPLPPCSALAHSHECVNRKEYPQMLIFRDSPSATTYRPWWDGFWLLLRRIKWTIPLTGRSSFSFTFLPFLNKAGFINIYQIWKKWLFWFFSNLFQIIFRYSGNPIVIFKSDFIQIFAISYCKLCFVSQSTFSYESNNQADDTPGVGFTIYKGEVVCF